VREELQQRCFYGALKWKEIIEKCGIFLKISFVHCKIIKRGSMEYALILRMGGNNHRITIVCYVKVIKR